MKQILALLLCIALPLAVFAGDASYKVTYDGGSLPDIKSGTGLHLFIQQDRVRFVRDGIEVASVPAAAITEVSYGQDVHRRVGAAVGLAVVSFGLGALMAFSKSKKHFVGVTWANGDKKGGLAMQCDKNEYRGILAGPGGSIRQESGRLLHDDGQELNADRRRRHSSQTSTLCFAHASPPPPAW